MAQYDELAKLGRVKLPSGTTYALIDVDGRAMLAPNFSTAVAYSAGDYVIYQDDLYRFDTAHAPGPWDPTQVTQVQVGQELKRIIGLISGGVHYRGKTTTPIHEGSTDNPITINGGSVTVIDGDMVTLDLNNVASTYATGTAYPVGTYLKNGNDRYYVKTAITATENTSISAIAAKLDKINAEPMFIWAEGEWNAFGGIGDGLGDLAYKDSASGTYTKPTGSGSVTIKDVTSNKAALATTTITGVSGTTSVSKATAGTAVNVATVDTAKRYGTANVGTAVVYGTANRAASATTVGNANVATSATAVATAGSTFYYGTADVDEAVSVATAGTQVTYGTANVGTAVTYGTANPGTAVSGIAKVGSQKTFNTDGIKVNGVIDGDCLEFVAAGTSTVIGIADTTGVSITPAVASNKTLTPAVASTSKLTPVGGTTSITPAKSAGESHSARGVGGTTNIYQAVASTTTIYGAVAAPDTQTLTPATEAPSTQTIIPAKANGSITPYTMQSVTVATANDSATTVATGGLTTGTQLVTDVNVMDKTATVTVNTTTDTVTVK